MPTPAPAPASAPPPPTRSQPTSTFTQPQQQQPTPTPMQPRTAVGAEPTVAQPPHAVLSVDDARAILALIGPARKASGHLLRMQLRGRARGGARAV